MLNTTSISLQLVLIESAEKQIGCYDIFQKRTKGDLEFLHLTILMRYT